MAITDLCGEEPTVSSSAMLPSVGFELGIGRKLASAGKSTEKPKKAFA